MPNADAERTSRTVERGRWVFAWRGEINQVSEPIEAKAWLEKVMSKIRLINSVFIRTSVPWTR